MLSNIVKRCFSTSGSLLTWGETTFGWGRPINEKYYTPGVVEGFNNIAHVASGPYHLAFATAESNVYTVGQGKNGRLGNGSESDADTPVKVDINGKVTQLACGTRHTLALTDSGDVYAWGYGGKPASFGCSWFGVHSPLGNGTTGSSFTPVKVNLKNVSQISAGNDISFALSNGLVYSWGQGLSQFYQEAVSTP
jgi:alpha-tubulin suppressor-like RCC1 family protein